MTPKLNTRVGRVVFSALVAVLTVANAGCSDDEDTTPQGTAGTAGAAGSAGSSGSSGTSGSAGSSGTAGSAGSAGSGGSAGASGTAGSAGNGGAAGTAGSSGSGGTAGSGGSAGTAGTAGTSLVADPVAKDPATFVQPFDASPSPDGTMVFFSAIDPATGSGAIFQPTAAAGGAIGRVDSGNTLVVPVGVAVSTSQIFVADLGGGSNDGGGIYAIPIAGGAPVLVSGTADVKPRGVTIFDAGGVETLAFTGQKVGNTAVGVYTIPAAGGSLTTVSEGAPFVDPSGVVVASSGDYYVLDSTQAGSIASVLKVSNGSASVLSAGLRVGYPAGIALSSDGSSVWVSGADAAGASMVIQIDVANQTLSTFNTNIAGTEPAGLHRATASEVYSFVDSTAGTSGTVWVLSYQ